MAAITISYGVALEILGLVGFLVTGAKSPTALIPCIFGTLIIACGVLANQRPDLRKHVMHGAAVLGLIAFLAPFRVMGPIITLLTGGQVARPAAVIAQTILLLLSAVFLAACIRSFISARRSPAT
jgi:hypothetical protein